jgi:hypothetical protein
MMRCVFAIAEIGSTPLSYEVIKAKPLPTTQKEERLRDMKGGGYYCCVFFLGGGM